MRNGRCWDVAVSLALLPHGNEGAASKQPWRLLISSKASSERGHAQYSHTSKHQQLCSRFFHFKRYYKFIPCACVEGAARRVYPCGHRDDVQSAYCVRCFSFSRVFKRADDDGCGTGSSRPSRRGQKRGVRILPKIRTRRRARTSRTGWEGGAARRRPELCSSGSRLVRLISCFPLFLCFLTVFQLSGWHRWC